MTRQELLPPELLKQIPELYSGEDTPLKEKIIKVKYFLANFTWLVTECEVREDGDVLFFGYIQNDAYPDGSEWGYFTLNQLMEVKVLCGVERDLYFDNCTFGEYMRRFG
jgi:hypothetical protein